MPEMITSLRLSLLQTVAKHPDAERGKLLALKGVEEADLAYLVHNDLIREGAVGLYRITHFGQMALKRGRG